MTREIKFRAWDSTRNNMNYKVCVGNTDFSDKNYTCSTILIYGKWLNFDDYQKTITMQYTGLKDKNGDKEIYEYDIIDGEGNIIGNYHETPELLEDKTNLLIQGFGTKTWLTTYQEAVERGCHDA